MEIERTGREGYFLRGGGGGGKMRKRERDGKGRRWEKKRKRERGRRKGGGAGGGAGDGDRENGQRGIFSAWGGRYALSLRRISSAGCGGEREKRGGGGKRRKRGDAGGGAGGYSGVCILLSFFVLFSVGACFFLGAGLCWKRDNLLFIVDRGRRFAQKADFRGRLPQVTVLLAQSC